MAAKTKKSKVSKKKSSSSKRSSTTSKGSSRSSRPSRVLVARALLRKAKEILSGKKEEVKALSKSESKRLATLQLEAIGDRNGAGVGMLKVYDGKKVETLTANNAEEYRQILRRIASGELRIAL